MHGPDAVAQAPFRTCLNNRGVHLTKEASMDDLRGRFETLYQRWSNVVWHREEVHRVIEMVKDDQRLQNTESTFIRSMHEWYVDHVCAAILGDIDGTAPSTARRIVGDVCAGGPNDVTPTAAPGVQNIEPLLTLWEIAVAASQSPIRWYRTCRLLLDGDVPSITYGDLDNAIDAMERVVLNLCRILRGAAPSKLLATEQFDWYDLFAFPWKERDELPVPTFESGIPPSESNREVAIFPWLEVRTVVNLLGVAILPRADALIAVGEDEAPLRYRTNYFYDAHHSRLTPSVALFPDDDAELSRARIMRAAHVALFASSALNAPGKNNYANATLLEYFFQRLGGPAEFVARRIRRRYGSILGGTHTALVRAQKPDWCGNGLELSPELIEAFETLSEDPKHDHIFDALRWYYVGSTDADPIPPDIDRVHIRTAIERLLQTPAEGRSPSTMEQMARIGRLTECFTTWVCDTYKGEKRNFHQQALWVLVNDRNVSIHGRVAQRQHYRFEAMGVPLDWIFDRLFISLTIASLISESALLDNPRWRAFIESFELWLAGAPGDINTIWAARELMLRFRKWDAAPRDPLPVDPALLDPTFVYLRQT